MMFKAASTDCGHLGIAGQAENTTVVNVLVNMLAVNSCLFTHPVDTEQLYHLFEVVFVST